MKGTARWSTILALTCLLMSTAHAATGDTVFLIMIDGAAYETVSRLYHSGKLPQMQRLARLKKGRLLRTVTTFPSSTAPSVPELLVGRYADRCRPDLLKRVQGFDRESGRIARYEFNRTAWHIADANLFNLVSRSGRRSFSYFEGAFRWASVNEFNPLGYGINFATGYSGLPNANYDRRVIDEALRDLRAERPPPALIFISLGAVDIAGHARGPDHPDYTKFLIENDVQIGRLVSALEKREHPKGGTAFDHSHFFIFGDHGMEPTSHQVQLGRVLQQSGIIAADGTDLGAMLQATVRRDWYKNFDAVVLGIGSNVADIQIRRRASNGSRRPWSERPSLAELRDLPVGKGATTLDLISLLLGQAGIDMLLLEESPGRVLLMAPGGGEAVVAREGTPQQPRRYAYQVLRTDAKGRDPLGYLQEPRSRTLVTPVCGELVYHDEQTWFEHTADSQHPYAPPLIPKAFVREPTAPDIVAISRPGFGFLPVVKGDHGSLRRESIASFLLVAGPHLAKKNVPETVRLIDANLEIRRILALPEDPMADSRGLATEPSR